MKSSPEILNSEVVLIFLTFDNGFQNCNKVHLWIDFENNRRLRKIKHYLNKLKLEKISQLGGYALTNDKKVDLYKYCFCFTENLIMIIKTKISNKKFSYI